MKGSRGFSLIEVVTVIGLTAAILFAVALLLQRNLSTLKFLQEKSESVLGATLGCERMCSELRETIVKPSPVGGSVGFRKVLPSAPTAVGNPEPPPPPPAPPALPPPPPAVLPHQWVRAYPAAQTATITYTRAAADQTLLRRVNGGAPMVVATSVSDFDCRAMAGTERTYMVKLSFQENRRVNVFTAAVYCPGAAE